jgi:uncharacterized alkaline shock family protein YloU
MSEATSRPSSEATEPAEGTAELETRPAANATDAADRGRLDIRTRAVEQIITAAAGEVDAVGGSVHRVLGQALGSADPDARPRAKATVAGTLVTGELSMSLPWGTPVPQAAKQVREHVAHRLDELARFRLGHLDITVTALPARTLRRRVA